MRPVEILVAFAVGVHVGLALQALYRLWRDRRGVRYLQRMRDREARKYGDS